MDYQQICNQTIEVVKSVAVFIGEESGKFLTSDVETKSLNSFVTYVDKTAEEKLVSGLQQILAGSGFITEEETIQLKGETYNWIIDPLDGTTNYIHKVPFFSISVALQENGETVVGVVMELNRSECFYTWKGGKAFLNGEVIHTSGVDKLPDTLVATGFPYYDFSILMPYLKIIEHLTQNSRGIRRLGSAAMDLAYVACGRFDVFFEHGLNPWDVAAGAFLVQQAGGKVSDFVGEDHYLFGREIIATAPGVYHEFAQLVHSKLKEA